MPFDATTFIEHFEGDIGVILLDMMAQYELSI